MKRKGNRLDFQEVRRGASFEGNYHRVTGGFVLEGEFRQLDSAEVIFRAIFELDSS